MTIDSGSSAKVVHIAAGKVSKPAVSLVRLPAPVHRVREKAMQLFQQAFKNLFDGADDALFQMADRAHSNEDQNIYFEAMREVRLKRREVEKEFFLGLDHAYAALLRPVQVDEDEYVTGLSVDELSIVGNDQLEYQVALEGLVAKAMKTVAEPSQHIAMRLDSLVPAKVYAQNNPLGPEMLCKVFWSVIEPLQLNIKAKLILLKLYERAVVANLGKIYEVLNNSLAQQNILPSLGGSKSTVRKNPAVRAQQSPIQQAAMASAAPADGSESDPHLWEKLRNLLNARADTLGDRLGISLTAGSGAPAFESDQLTRALSAVQSFLQARNIDTGQSLLNANQILKLVQQQGHSQAKFSEIDRDVIHLINMMFEFILDDRNLSTPMKALLARLQIPMLKVALEDKSFFNVAGHPARRLLNELATAALGWQPPEEGEPRDLLFRKIESTVASVLSDFETDIGVFDALLTDFIAFVEKEQRRAVVLEKRTIDAEDGKAKAEQAKARVDEQLASATLGKTLPECVSSILDGPWHNVMFLLLLKHGEQSENWLSACDTADDLVWSVTASMDAEDRSRLMSLLPDLLGRLKAGFELIAFNSFEMNTLFRQLETEHLDRLRQQDPPVLTRVVDPETGQSAADLDAARLQQELKAKQQAADAFSGDDLGQDFDEEPVSSAWLEQVDRFAQGSWFEVNEPDKPAYRCRLAAVIRSVDRFIFVNRNGMKVAEKNRVDLARALEAGQLQILDDGMLFDRALESVIGNLRDSRHRR